MAAGGPFSLAYAPAFDAGAMHPPSVAQVRRWTGVTTASISDEDLSVVLAAELHSQSRTCRVDPYWPDLYQAVLRRCARHLAARGVPLGMTGGEAEFGPARLSSFDGEIDRLEGPHRRLVFG